MMRLLNSLLCGLLLILLDLYAPKTVIAAEFAASAQQITPLLLGSPVPDASLHRIDGSSVSLSQLIAAKPAILVFYRGGWCPYCNLQLSGLRLIENDLAKEGYQLIAISPDRPEELRKTLDRDALSYTLVSDSSAQAMKAFGIAYRVDEVTLSKYANMGIDLDKASGENHHALPVPAVFIIDAEGVIQFEYVHPDYRVRVPADVILTAARAIARQKHRLNPKH